MANDRSKGPLESFGWALRVLGTVLSAKFMLSSLKQMERQREREKKRKQQAQQQGRTYTLPREGSEQEPPEPVSYEDLL